MEPNYSAATTPTVGPPPVRTPLFCDRIHNGWINSVCWLVPPVPLEPCDFESESESDDPARGGKVWLVTGSSDRTISVHQFRGFGNWGSPKLTKVWQSTSEPGDGPIYSVAFSPDGTMLASAGATRAQHAGEKSSGRVSIWDVTQSVPRSIWAHAEGQNSSPVRCVAWDPDSAQVGIGSEDNTVRIIDIRKPLQLLLELLMCARTTQDWEKLAIGLAQSAVAVNHTDLLMQQQSAGEIRQNGLSNEKGWTVFHELAQCVPGVRAGDLWSTLLEHYAEHKRVYTPLLDSDHKTALDHAILRKDVAGVEFFCKTLTAANSLECAGSVTHSLVLLADSLPRQIVKALTWLDTDRGSTSEPASFQNQRNIRYLAVPIEARLTRASADADASRVWDGIEIESHESSDSSSGNLFDCECELKLLAFKGIAGSEFAGGIETSPYHKLVSNCPPTHQEDLFRTSLIRVMTEFKWKTYARDLKRTQVAFNLAHYLLVCVALVLSTRITDRSAFGAGSLGGLRNESAVISGWSEWVESEAFVCTFLHCVMMLSNTVMLWAEVKDMVMEYRLTGMDGLSWYFSSMWNYVDCLGVLCLYGASYSYFHGNTKSLQHFGTAGTLFNLGTFLQSLQPLDEVFLGGIHVIVLTKIISDSVGFMFIFCMMLYGFAVALTVSMPASDAYDIDDKTLGLGAPLVKILEAMSGAYEPDDYGSPEAATVLIIFIFAIIIIMLNMLIALMSDTYEDMMENKAEILLHAQAATIIDLEHGLTREQLQNKAWFPQYIQVLQPVVYSGVDYIGRRKMAIEAERNEARFLEACELSNTHSKFMERRLNELETAQTELKQELKQDLQHVVKLLTGIQQQRR
eukprot:COSAG06_NODE_581_length_14007_cov_3.569056_16_plen_854_part_00